MNLSQSMKPHFRASVKNDGGADVLELLVYEQIGENWWSGGGITAKVFKQKLDAVAGAYSRISLRINSPGGDAFEGVAILNLLRSQGKPVDVCIDGIAASAASIIAMCGSTITMGSGAMMMIHNAWSIVMGNAEDLTKEAATLSAIDKSIAQTYVDRTGQKFEDVKAMMDAETWLGADECIEKGFATAKAVAAEDPQALAMAREFKALAKFAKVPAQFKAEATPEPSEDEALRANGVIKISDELFQQMSIPAMFARMTANRMLHCDVSISEKELFCLRRVAGAAINLAPRADGSSSAPRVSGIVAPYGSPSGDIGGFQEVYQAGCFDKFLGSDDPRVLAFHNPEQVLGRKSAGTARFWSDAKGLHYEADLPDTQVARDLRVSMERGDVRESSAAFYITDYAWENRDGIRTRVIKEARLVEASPYSFPAYTESTATSEETPQDAIADTELELIGARLLLLKIA